MSEPEVKLILFHVVNDDTGRTLATSIDGKPVAQELIDQFAEDTARRRRDLDREGGSP